MAEVNSERGGVFFASATRLHDDFIQGQRQFVSAADVLSRSNPLPCFACCPYARPRRGNRIFNFFDIYYPEEVRPSTSVSTATQDADIDDQNPRGLHTELPPYISAFINQAGKDNPAEWEREFRESLQEFHAILVTDLRGEE